MKAETVWAKFLLIPVIAQLLRLSRTKSRPKLIAPPWGLQTANKMFILFPGDSAATVSPVIQDRIAPVGLSRRAPQQTGTTAKTEPLACKFSQYLCLWRINKRRALYQNGTLCAICLSVV